VIALNLLKLSSQWRCRPAGLSQFEGILGFRRAEPRRWLEPVVDVFDLARPGERDSAKGVIDTQVNLGDGRCWRCKGPVWVIHVIPAIPACPVRPKSRRSADARFYEYERAHRSL